MRVAGSVRPPGDKSISHRALMLAALAHGRSELSGLLTSDDLRSAASMLRRLGATISPLRGGRVVVEGRPWRAPSGTLHCGNSGTAARLVLGLLAAHDFPARLTGDRSLRRRPMERVTEPLGRMGARFGTAPGGRLPIAVHGGPLQAVDYESPVASAQVKSAILFAALAGNVAARVTEPWKSRDHTERLLAHLGIPVDAGERYAALGPVGRGAVPPFSLHVPGDPSSAAFLVAAALLAESGEIVLTDVAVNPTRVGFLRVLGRMGAAIEVTGERLIANEPVADLVVKPASLRSTVVEAREIPSLVDEVPILAAVASRAAGETRFCEVGELRVKESNRLEQIAASLRGLGTAAEVRGEDLVVGGGSAPPRGRVDTAGDHRLAMAFSILGTLPGAELELSERASVAVSYPGFFDDLRRIDADAR